MCLYISKRARQRIAKKDIYVYKVLEKTIRGYITPYYYLIVPEDGILIPGEFKEGDDIPVDNNCYAGRTISEGAIHSFLRKEFADLTTFHNDVVVEAIIPKGTKYYTNEHEYASQKLIVTLPKDK